MTGKNKKMLRDKKMCVMTKWVIISLVDSFFENTMNRCVLFNLFNYLIYTILCERDAPSIKIDSGSKRKLTATHMSEDIVIHY